MGEVAFVALGSNLGNRAAYLAAARSALSLLPGTRLVATSRVEESVPFGPVAQGPFLNQMVALRTTLAPLPLLGELQRVEHALGRVRGARWGARTIDLDLVRHGDARLDHPRLVLPHPGIGSRDFWQREERELQAILGTAA